MENGKTIRQIADEIGVSKQAVQKRLAREPLYTNLKPHVYTKGSTKYIMVVGEKLVKSAFSENERQPVADNQPTTDNQNVYDVHSDVYSVLKLTIETLQKQLDAKDVQIAEKDKQLADLTEANKNLSQSINADRHNELAETIIDGQATIPESLSGQSDKKSHSSFWNKFFRKKRN